MKNNHKSAQSILEYTLLLAVLIAIIVSVMVANGGVVRRGVEDAYDKAGAAMSNAADNITDAVFK